MPSSRSSTARLRSTASRPRWTTVSLRPAGSPNHGDQLGVDPTRVAIGGASAGGNLAAVVAHLARDQGGPALVLQVLVYPATDHRARGDTSAPGAFDRADADWCWSHYLGGASGDDPRASPLRAPDFRRLPPALVIAAAHDPLREEGELYAEALVAAGVEVEHASYEEVHGFFSTPGSTGADAARARVVKLYAAPSVTA